MKTVSIHVRMTGSMREALDAASKRSLSGESISDIIRKAVEREIHRRRKTK